MIPHWMVPPSLPSLPPPRRATWGTLPRTEHTSTKGPQDPVQEGGSALVTVM